ncbi:MAG: DCC1-like thiol-disulfide oxidoreductase family protein [Gemmatimonadota bacterium]
MPAAPPVLLYDGLCGFCDRTVRFLLTRDPGGAMRFAPLQGETADGVVRRHPWLEGVDSLVLVMRRDAGESVYVRSDAVLGVAEYLGGLWRLAGVCRLVPRVVRDWAYDLFARYRFIMAGRRDTCRIPDPDERTRFLP